MSALKFSRQVLWTGRAPELPQVLGQKLTTAPKREGNYTATWVSPPPPPLWALPGLGCNSSHRRSWTLDPKPHLCGPERRGLFTGCFPPCSAYIWAGVQKMPNNNSPNPSMKKETHCVYRYRIWHLKHESTFGLGASGQGCWTLASLL